MAKNSGGKGIDTVLGRLKNIKELNGMHRTVEVIIESNGKEDREDPAYYGAIHNREGSKYEFTRGVMEEQKALIKSNPEIRAYLRKILESKVKRRSSDLMDEASELMGKVMAENVVENILTMPQHPQPWKKSGLPNLIETYTLLNSIGYRVKKER